MSLLALFLATARAASWTATPFNPPSIPLAVRTPYLSAWLGQGTGVIILQVSVSSALTRTLGVALNDAWPTFWTGSVCPLLLTDLGGKFDTLSSDSWLGWFSQGRRNGVQLHGAT